jgi:hypothetical protein
MIFSYYELLKFALLLVVECALCTALILADSGKCKLDRILILQPGKENISLHFNAGEVAAPGRPWKLIFAKRHLRVEYPQISSQTREMT